MSSREFKRFPKSALKRYSEIILRHLYQCGGRERYVPVTELEDALGLEPELVLELCRKHLLGEVHVADRPSAELESGGEFHTALERELFREYLSRPHVRLRPGCVRLTEQELLRRGKRGRNRRRRKRSKRR